jgi:hypothetical protein
MGPKADGPYLLYFIFKAAFSIKQKLLYKKLHADVMDTQNFFMQHKKAAPICWSSFLIH